MGQASATTNQRTRVIAVGEVMVEMARGADNRFGMACGGDTFNTAVYLARAGIDVSYATALGDDPYSEGIMAMAAAENVKTDLVIRVPGRTPGLYTIETDPRGERHPRVRPAHEHRQGLRVGREDRREARLEGNRQDDLGAGVGERLERRTLGRGIHPFLGHDDDAEPLQSPIDEERGCSGGEGLERLVPRIERVRICAELVDPRQLRVGPFAELRHERGLPEGTPREEPESEGEEDGDDGHHVVPERDHAEPPSWNTHWRTSSTSCSAHRRSGGDTRTTASIAKTAAPMRRSASPRRTRGA